MRLVPEGKADKVLFFQSKLAPWAARAASIGTTDAAVADLGAKVAAARDRLAEQFAAEQAARTATQAADLAVGALAAAGADIIKAIRATAAAGGDAVYVLAEIPAPAAPRPVTTLGQPTGFRVALRGDGALTLKWKCASPRASGVMYQVWRSTDGGAHFSYAGGTGSKTFVDDMLPAGTASVLYKVQAARSTAMGPCATFTVLLGTTAAGRATASLLQLRKRAA